MSKHIIIHNTVSFCTVTDRPQMISVFSQLPVEAVAAYARAVYKVNSSAATCQPQSYHIIIINVVFAVFSVNF